MGILMFLSFAVYVSVFMPTTEQLRSYDGNQGMVIEFQKYLVENIFGYDVNRLQESRSSIIPVVLHYLGGAICMA